MVVVPPGEFMMGSGKNGDRSNEKPLHKVDDRQGFRGRQVRRDVCGVGCLRGRRRLQAQALRQLGARAPTCAPRILERCHQGVSALAEPADRQNLSAPDRGRVGVCGAWRHECFGRAHGLSLGQRHRQEPGELQGLWQSMGREATRAGGVLWRQRVRPARHARQRAAVGSGLLPGHLQGCAVRRRATADVASCDRVERGGSWFNGAVEARSAERSRSEPNARASNIGLRVARPL